MPPISLTAVTLDTVDENLALDEALLLSAEAGESGEVLRFWEWPTLAVVLGAGGSIAIDVDEEACRIDSVPIHRRASGGGTVLLGRGCLLFSLILSYQRAAELRDVNASYRWILRRISDALQTITSIEHAGTSDLALRGRKISGNAQQRKARHLLHHGTLLYDVDLKQIGRYLKRPEREPAYREAREHAEFMTHLETTSNELMRLIANQFEASRADVSNAAIARITDLVKDRYSQSEWVRRR
jgi:lipoate-protein ligase A